MPNLDADLSAFAEMRENLEAHLMGRWILIHDTQLIGDFDSFDAAAKAAVSKFGRGPYLIRQVGAAAITLPAAVAFFQHGSDKMRV